MLFKLFTILSLTAGSSALNPVERTPEPTEPVTTPTSTSINYDRLSSQLHSLVGDITLSALAPTATETLAISIPPSLKYEIMTAIPMDVLIKLMNPPYRASVASDFAAGNTPGWYAVSTTPEIAVAVELNTDIIQSMPEDVQVFFESMAGEINTGTAVFTRTPTPTVTDSGSVNGGSGSQTALATTASSDLAVPNALTREMVAGAVAVAVAAGAAMVL